MEETLQSSTAAETTDPRILRSRSMLMESLSRLLTRKELNDISIQEIAEEAGLIWSLDQWILAQACRDAAALRRAGVLGDDARLAVNISARNVADPDLVEVVRQAADSAQLPFHALDLEVTETGFADEIAAAASLVMGQADEAMPMVLVRGLTWTAPEADGAALVRPPEHDLFR